MNKIYVITSLILLLSFCNGNYGIDEKKIVYAEGNEILQGIRMDAAENLYQIMGIGLVTINDTNYALVADASRDAPLHLINISEDIYISGISHSGRGPGEFDQTPSISVFIETFILSDSRNSRLTHIPFEVFTDSEMRDHSKFKLENLQFSGLPLNVHPVDSVNYLVVGPVRDSGNKRFTIVNKEKGTNKLIGSHEIIDAKLDPNYNQLINRERGTFFNQKSRFATGKYHKDQIDIFDFEANLIASYKGPDYDEIILKNNGDRYIIDVDSEKNIISYVDITSNDDFIYALYSGKNLNQSRRNLGDIVVVIDWNGSYVRSYQLDQQAIRIAVDDENSMLLAAVHTEDYGLYKYKINE